MTPYDLQPSWEVFDECDTCCADAKQPCYSLRSTSKNLTPLANPHAGRKRLKWNPKECNCLGLTHQNSCSEWVLPV